MVGPKRVEVGIFGEKHRIVFTQCELGDWLLELEASWNSILTLILLRLNLPEVLP